MDLCVLLNNGNVQIYDIYIDLVSGKVTKNKSRIYTFIYRGSQILFPSIIMLML